MQLVGEVMGQVSDALHNSGVNGFDETNVKNNIDRIILEAAGSAAVAGATGGNVGAAAGSAVGGNVLSSATLNSIKQWADANSNGDPKLAMALTNAIENAIAAAGGAAAGGAIGGGSGALNGSDISSALQQYNMALFLQQQASIAAAGGGAITAGNNPNALTDADIKQIQNAFNNSVDNTENLIKWGPLYAYAYLYSLIYGDTQSSGSNSNNMTAHPDAGKPTIVSTPANEPNWWDSTVSTPITDQDKNSGSIIDPFPDNVEGWNDEGFTINPDAGKGTIVTSTGNPPPNLSPDGAGRNGALREAKRYVGIPVTQQPESIGPNINKQGKVVGGMDYVYTPTGQDSKFIAEDGKIHIRDDADGHMYIDDPTQDRGSHFNTGDGAHFDYKK